MHSCHLRYKEPSLRWEEGTFGKNKELFCFELVGYVIVHDRADGLGSGVVGSFSGPFLWTVA